MATPLTELRLLNNVDLDVSYTNTFSKEKFGNLAGQISFFSGKTVHSFTNLTFQRKEKTIKVKRSYEDIESLSYGMFKNGTSGKWYFFFIVDYMYISENVTEIKVEIDVEQTYLFDVSLGDCFVEREHVETDAIGDHLIDEGLSTGDYVIRSNDTFLALNPLAVVIASTYDPLTSSDSFGTTQTGIFQGVSFFAFDRNDIIGLNSFLLDTTSAAKSSAIVSIFMIPLNLLPPFNSGDKIDVPNAQVIYQNYPLNSNDIDGYAPKNNKLFTFPYNFLYVSNNNGSFAAFKYEFFSGQQAEFQATGNVAPAPIVSLIPRNYKGVVANFDEMLRLGDYPLCSWTTDAFLGYLAQNAVSAPISLASSGLSAFGSVGGAAAASATPLGAAVAALEVSKVVGGFAEASLQPNQIKGSVSGGSNTAIGVQTFSFLPKTIRSEQARVIDDFFTKYGYKVNQLKTPNTASRTRFNYLKVQDCVIKGNVPRIFLQTMKDNREKGITFWHVDEIGDYSSNGFTNWTPVVPPSNNYPSNNLGYAFPIEQNVNYTVTSFYGERVHPITGDPDFHYGVDIAAPEGTDIVSVLDGEVQSTGYDSVMGNYVFVLSQVNGQFIVHNYQHMVSPAYVTSGQLIEKGATIGGVGTTGSSTGNHLHIGVTINGSWVDPWLYINPSL